MFAADVDGLSAGFASKLKTMLEQHIGLRVYYPGLSEFYRDVQSGRSETPLPLDAVDGFVEVVRQATPEVFSSFVGDALEGTTEPAKIGVKVVEMEATSAQPGTPMPPKDPLGELDPKKSHEFTVAGSFNALWRVFLKGEKINKAAEGWEKTGQALRPHAGRILGWLERFMDFGSGGPPVPPIMP
jgi:hypothetical protein